MDKDKVVVVLQRTITSLKSDLDIALDKKDSNGVHYYKGRIEGLQQFVDVVKDGRFDKKEEQPWKNYH